MSRLLACSFALLLAGCATRPVELAAPIPVPVPFVPPPAPMPKPPQKAALNLTIPAKLADGSYLTPNRSLSPAATLWHLRAALNVAALACPDAALSGGYNTLLATHRRALADAHKAATREQGGAAPFDVAMTKVYNYFAQPPAQAGFCAEAVVVMAQATATSPEALPGFAVEALARLDRPFTDFYAAYDRYRTDLADWQAGRAPPQIAYDLAAIRGATPMARTVAAR